MNASSSTKLPYVSIIGRPNVGKSSLFNALTKSRKQIIHDVPGTTRDRQEALIDSSKGAFIIADTGGMPATSGKHVDRDERKQIDEAIKNSDIILFVCDIKEGLSTLDEEIARWLHRENKEVILVCNKADNRKLDQHLMEFYALGLGDPIAISVLHRRGLKTLLEFVQGKIQAVTVSGNKYTRIAIAGRPNVGKSSLVNYILKHERVIVSDQAGTTRDAIDIVFSNDKSDFIITDTAGIRSKSKIKGAVGTYSLMRSFDTIKMSHIVFLMIDAEEGLTKDDRKIIDFSYKNGKCAILIVNKWDLIKNVQMYEYEQYINKTLNAGKKLPLVFISCKTGRNIERLLNLAAELYQKSNQAFSSSKLQKVVLQIEKKLPRKMKKGQAAKVYYLLQSGKLPIKFLVTVNNPKLCDESFRSGIENMLRKNFDLEGVSFIMDFVSKSKRS